MQLSIRWCRMPNGAKALVLCDGETGEQLPGQRASTFAVRVDEQGLFTVEFVVDGRCIRPEWELEAEKSPLLRAEPG